MGGHGEHLGHECPSLLRRPTPRHRLRPTTDSHPPMYQNKTQSPRLKAFESLQLVHPTPGMLWGPCSWCSHRHVAAVGATVANIWESKWKSSDEAMVCRYSPKLILDDQSRHRGSHSCAAHALSSSRSSRSQREIRSVFVLNSFIVLVVYFCGGFEDRCSPEV